MNRWRVGEDRGSKEMDGCPLTISVNQSQTYHFQDVSNQRTNGDEQTNVGLINTIGEGAERPGISSNQIPII
jgi:hypothetical protein